MGFARISAALIAVGGLLACPMTMAEPAPGVHRIAFINSGPRAANETNLALGIVIPKTVRQRADEVIQ